jgi:hypothetical protein
MTEDPSNIVLARSTHSDSKNWGSMWAEFPSVVELWFVNVGEKNDFIGHQAF